VRVVSLHMRALPLLNLGHLEMLIVGDGRMLSPIPSSDVMELRDREVGRDEE
jgi:hypothetical protein